jgi:hypothetical protein
LLECIFIFEYEGGGEVVKGRVDGEDEEAFDDVWWLDFEGNEGENGEDAEGDGAWDGVEREEEEGGEGEEEDDDQASYPYR